MSVEVVAPVSAEALEAAELEAALNGANAAVLAAVEPLRAEYDEAVAATLNRTEPGMRPAVQLRLDARRWATFGEVGSALPSGFRIDWDGEVSYRALPEVADRIITGGMWDIQRRCGERVGMSPPLRDHLAVIAEHTPIGRLLRACEMPEPRDPREQPLSNLQRLVRANEIQAKADRLPAQSPHARAYQRQATQVDLETAPLPVQRATLRTPVEQAKHILERPYGERHEDYNHPLETYEGFSVLEEGVMPQVAARWALKRGGFRSNIVHSSSVFRNNSVLDAVEEGILICLASGRFETVEQVMEEGVREASALLGYRLGNIEYITNESRRNFMQLKRPNGHVALTDAEEGVLGEIGTDSKVGFTGHDAFMESWRDIVGLKTAWRMVGRIATGRLVEMNGSLPNSALDASGKRAMRVRLPGEELRVPRIAGYSIIGAAVSEEFRRYDFAYDGREVDPRRECLVEVPVDGRARLAQLCRGIKMTDLADKLDPAQNPKPLTVSALERLLERHMKYVIPKDAQNVMHSGGDDFSWLREDLSLYKDLVDDKGRLVVQCTVASRFMGELITRAFPGKEVSVTMIEGKSIHGIPVQFLRRMNHAQLSVMFKDQGQFIFDPTPGSVLKKGAKDLAILAGGMVVAVFGLLRRSEKLQAQPTASVTVEIPEQQKLHPSAVWAAACSELNGIFHTGSPDELAASLGQRPAYDPARVTLQAIYDLTHAADPETLRRAKAYAIEAAEHLAAIETGENPAAMIRYRMNSYPKDLLAVLQRLLRNADQAIPNAA